ncbi:MAG: hypothetical protein AB1798_20020, partial [Spirochaetota bacterium]
MHGRCLINSVKYPNRELVLYALYILGGDSERVHTEDIALKCFQLYPNSFSWIKYPQYPDKDIVRVSLTDARKNKYGALVEGRTGQKRGQSAKTSRSPIEDGWMLTLQGISWIKKNLDRLEKCGGIEQLEDHRQKVLKQLKRFREHPLFIRYMARGEDFSPTIGELADMLRCRVDAEQEIWKNRFKKVRFQAAS